jgi:Pup amidohydrolase
MRPILAGIETEYGLAVEGRGAEDQVDDATGLVRGLTDEAFFVGWDYSAESPLADLRGFRLDRLAEDPVDAEFDRGRSHAPMSEVRADRVLPNGARFYNDHGHPEYATPECWGVAELALHDRAGEQWVRQAGVAFERATGRRIRLYKNNSDGHGASYGTHESYLVERSLGFETLYRALTPILVARTLLCGAGKVGAEAMGQVEYQMSQRADFFTEAANAETLYRRPVFNTRDEPHADPARWVRIHVIAGDANMIAGATRRKVALAKIALHLAEIGEAPAWDLREPFRDIQRVSRDLTGQGHIELAGGSWTTARHVIEAYLDAFERHFERAEPVAVELFDAADECRWLLDDLSARPAQFARSVDWAAKRSLIAQFLDAEGTGWRDPVARSLDLAYHDLDPDDGLFPALLDADAVDGDPPAEQTALRARQVCEPTRAFARSVAVRSLGPSLVGVSWGRLALETSAGLQVLSLPPDAAYPECLDGQDADGFAETVRSLT